MQIRVARRADIAAVDALLARAYPRLLKADYPPSLLVTAIPLIARAQPRLVTSGSYFVAEDEGQIIGAGGWTADRADPARGNIRHVVTDDRRLREGIGRAIITRALDEAAAAGVTRMDCSATRTAVPFYAALGFESVGPVTVALAPGIDFPAIAMRRNLG